MKANIKAIVLGLLFSVALVACNNDFEAGKPITYPEKPELGIYTNTYVKEGGSSYTVNLTLNEKGDTICDVTTYNASSGSYNTFSAGKVSYDKSVGVLTVDYDDSPYEAPAQIAIAYSNDLQQYIVTLYSNNGKLQRKDMFNATKTDAISYYGDWQLSDGKILSLAPDGTAKLLDGENIAASGNYTVNGSSVTTTLDGKTYTLTTNAQGQTFDADGKYMQHIMTQPINDWYEYAIGSYQSWLFTGTADALMEYSPSRKIARLSPFIMNRNGYLSFYWNIGEATGSADNASGYATGYTYSQDGQALGEVYGLINSVKYADNVFTINMTYQIPGVGGFGADNDTFTITEKLAE